LDISTLTLTLSLTLTSDFRQASINISHADIVAISEECEITKEQAEALLRKHGGELKAAVTAYIRVV
jgi:post-segregation antitoxin (ccd killing protein)